MSARDQVEKSKAFKHGDFNVLVSTSVCKEGIDVGTCKVGIEHGGLISSTELTQFMGKSYAGMHLNCNASRSYIRFCLRSCASKRRRNLRDWRRCRRCKVGESS